MVDLTQYQELVVQQEVEHLEVFTGFETGNRYSVLTTDGEQLLYAYEESGALSRQFLSTHRPLTLHVIDEDSRPVLTASRGFFWIRSHLHIRDASDNPIGSLHRKLAFLGRKLDLEDPTGLPIAEVRGRMMRPNTFMIYSPQGTEIARITKEWGGVMREAFTDADTFRVQFHEQERDQEFCLLVLATAFAIDLDFFENKGSRIGFR